MALPSKIILKHPSGQGWPSFDWLIKKGTRLKKDLKEEIRWLYQVGCSHVKKFLESHPEYKYLGSEDLGHIPEVNEGVREFIERCKKDGFEIIEEKML